MRNIGYDVVVSAISELCISACCRLGDDVKCALKGALSRESSAIAREILKELLENLELARVQNRPCCQDTGMAVVFAELGQDVHIEGGLLYDAINDGVRRAYTEGYLRKSVLSPIARVNTGDNTPAVIHTRLVAGDRLTIFVAPKGFGSENMSAVKMLTPSEGYEGILEFVVDTVRRAGSNPCPPVVVGVGVGGTMEKAALMAKHSLLRDVSAPGDSEEAQALERELLTRINALGIGPMGFGGDTTALAVHAELFPTHIAGLPVAVNMQCHAARHKRVEL